MVQKRDSGVLLHISSLPGKYGVGDLGSSAYRFVDMLADNGFTYWQILPLGPLGPGNSPYQAYSAYAGDSIYISPEELFSWGLMDVPDEESIPLFSKKEVQFQVVNLWKDSIFKQAFQKFLTGFDNTLTWEYRAFRNEHGWWLDDYALYMAIRKDNDNQCWNLWDDELKNRDEAALEMVSLKLHDEIEMERFKQFLFFRQWFRLKNYANVKGVHIFGDMPLYVSLDSSDVWSNQLLFLLDSEGLPTLVGGVPPDYFSEDGQRWGNPVFNWENLKQQDYHWWIARLYFNLHLFNVVRIDHFRGLESFWAIPADSETAKVGEWLPAHGDAILKIMRQRMHHLPIIAEDLGIITHAVEHLRDKYHLPGMKVLQFAFATDSSNEHLPHQHVPNSVVYTGTHDNNTILGWWNEMSPEEKQNVRKYLPRYRGDIIQRMIEMAWASVAKTAIVPLQDILHLGSSARMNTPGTAEGNWGWRFRWRQLRNEQMEFMKELNETYNRMP